MSEDAQISIHALHEESDALDAGPAQRDSISIHALHEESDEDKAIIHQAKFSFQSTLSMRRATQRRANMSGIPPSFQSTLSMRRATQSLHDPPILVAISIHALHEESDPRLPRDRASERISIHALHEESDRRDEGITDRAIDISIHALHEESDGSGAKPKHTARHFNPRSP